MINKLLINYKTYFKINEIYIIKLYIFIKNIYILIIILIKLYYYNLKNSKFLLFFIINEIRKYFKYFIKL